MNDPDGGREGLLAARSRLPVDARRVAAAALFAHHEGTLRRTARRYSLCADDADEALQRAVELVLTKAPTDDPQELIRWAQTVTKHEALAVRQGRERVLSPRSSHSQEEWVDAIPARSSGPAERAEQRETLARTREALKALKPAELRALSLLAEGYSYVEIGRITGFTQTKINRALAEGRERFRRLLTDSEDGSRCAELRPRLSAFCDGKLSGPEAETLREHLRACGGCRATLRAYRAAPGAAAALAPVLPASRSLLERAHDAFAGLASRLPGQGGADGGLAQTAAAGGTRGAGATALAKLLMVCAGAAGGTAACIATGIVPAPLDLAPRQVEAPRFERQLLDSSAVEALSAESGPVYEPAPEPQPEQPEPKAKPPRTAAPTAAAPATEPEPQPEATSPVEYAPPPAPVPAPAPAPSGSSSGSAAGEFGP